MLKWLPRMLRLVALVVCFVGGGLGSVVSLAADAEELSRRTAELERIQRELGELEQVMSETESSRTQAQRQVAEIEREVSQVSRKIRDLTEQRVAVQQALAEREDRQAEVAQRVAERQEELAAWVRRHYMYGGSDVAPFLSGGDPNEIARDVRYLEYIGRARSQLLESLRADLREQKRLAESIRQRRDELEHLQQAQQAQLAELEQLHAQRAQALASLSGRLREQQRKAETLSANEEELGRVVDVLTRRAERERRPERARAGSGGRASIAPDRDSAEAVVGRATTLAGNESLNGAFPGFRGRLGFPVRGELLGRFGAQRADGGTRWRGVFIRADGGEDVRAIAPGQVVFSDWMRGYGNLIIVDHGSEYLSIYANNDALLRVVGDRVEAGTTIASVGTSGADQQVGASGVYFELRHKGEPVDPMQWLSGGG